MLVTYASRTGSTTDIGQRIAEILLEQGLDVLASPMHGIDQWDIVTPVVLGSAIRYGGWLPEAVRFVKTHQAMLRECPVAVFSVGIKPEEPSHDYLRGIRGILRPQTETFFMGRLDPTLIGIERSTELRLQRVLFGDHIDWVQVEAWANHLYIQFSDGEWS